MHRQHHRWYSPALHREMDLLEFGHGGAIILAFPTSGGRFYEWEDRKMVEALRPMLDRGWFKLVCVDAVDRTSWYDYRKHPADRVRRQLEYDAYLLNEVLPFAHSRTSDHYVITTGASFGAYHAVSFGMRHPDRVRRIVSMSGLVDIKMFADGHFDDGLYGINPIDFIPNERDGYRLHHLRQQDVILAVGNGDRLVHQNRELSGKLWGIGVGNALREWDGFAHDWPVWHKMITMYVGGHD